MNIDRLRADITRHECIGSEPALRPYADTVGKITIGVGRNLTDNGITLEEADQMFDHDMWVAIKDTRVLVASFDELTDARREVLVNMMFNLGYPRLAKFVRMLEAIADGLPKTVALEMLDSKWATQVGKRATELSERYAEG